MRQGTETATAADHERLARARAGVAARPDSAVAEHNLASALGDKGDFAGAEAATARALAKGGDAAETWLVRGRALQGLARLDEAEAALAAAIARRPGYAVAHRDLAQLRWMRTADVRHALAAIAAAPATTALIRVHATVLTEAGEGAAAATLLARAVAARPTDPDLRLMAAAACGRQGDAPAQLAHATAALSLARASAEAAKAAVEALLHAGRAGEAAALAERLIAAVPDDQGAIALACTAWRLTGDPRHAAWCEDPALVSAATIPIPPGWPDLPAFLADLAADLATRHRWRTHPLEQSVRHGSQTQEDLARLDVPVLRALFAALDAPIAAHLAALGAGDDPVRRRMADGYRFAGAWPTATALPGHGRCG